MKKLFLLFLLTITVQSFADEFKVKSFIYNPNSQIAQRYPRSDQNNQPCALVLVETRLRDIIFEADQAIVGDIKLKQGKFYLYIPNTVTHLKFTKEGFDAFEYTLPISIRSSAVYDLNLDAIITEKPVEEVVVVVQEETPSLTPIPEQAKAEEKILVKVEEKTPEPEAKPKEVITSQPITKEEIPLEEKEILVEEAVKVEKQVVEEVVKTPEPKTEETPEEKIIPVEEAVKTEKQVVEETVKTPEPKTEDTPEEKTTEPIIKEVIEKVPEIPAEDIMLVNDIPLKTAPEIENMVYVQGGCFNMGSYFGDKDELPVHKVCLDDFYIGKYEVTLEEYAAFLNGISCNPDGTKDNQKLVSIGTKIQYENGTFIIEEKNAKLPAETITWYGAKAYAEWAEGRLPTEAEWEFAARGGLKMKPTAYAGSDSIYDISIYSKNSGNRPQAVGSKVANELGIFDMSGNAYEWVEDMYHKSYYAKSPEKNPQGSPFGQMHILRGGSFGHKAGDCRVANRQKYMPANSMYYFGFRIAKSVPKAEE